MKSTMSSKGQLTVPIELREKLGLTAGTVVQFELRGSAAVLRKGNIEDHPVDRLFGVLDLGKPVDDVIDQMRGLGPPPERKGQQHDAGEGCRRFIRSSGCSGGGSYPRSEVARRSSTSL